MSWFYLRSRPKIHNRDIISMAIVLLNRMMICQQFSWLKMQQVVKFNDVNILFDCIKLLFNQQWNHQITTCKWITTWVLLFLVKLLKYNTKYQKIDFTKAKNVKTWLCF